MKNDCCESMKEHLKVTKCDQHGEHCPDRLILENSFGRFLLVAQNAAYDFEFCPWCGHRVQEPDGDPGARKLY